MAEQKQEDFMTAKWRPAMGWSYMIICVMDMVIFPVIWSLAQVLTKQPITQWNPLTLQGAGLFHMAMGAVLGIAAFGRTQEKVAKIETAAETPPSAPAPTPAPAPVATADIPSAAPIATADIPSAVSDTGSKVADRLARFKK